MKKLLIIVSFMMSFMMISCTEQKNNKELNIYMPDGAPALAMANVLDEGFTHDNVKASFNIVSAEIIAQSVSSSACDLAIMPTTAAATLYNKGTDIKLVSTNIMGNLYIVGTNELTSLEALKGKTVYTTTGTTIALVKYLLNANDIDFTDTEEGTADNVKLTSLGDATAIIQTLKQATTKGEEAYGVLGEPVVTKALAGNTDLKITFDLQALYATASNVSGGYPQASLVVKGNVYENYKGFVDALVLKLEDNNTYLSSHTSTLPDVFKKYDSSLQNMTFTADTIIRSNVNLTKASDIKASVISYVKALAKIDLDDKFFC